MTLARGPFHLPPETATNWKKMNMNHATHLKTLVSMSFKVPRGKVYTEKHVTCKKYLQHKLSYFLKLTNLVNEHQSLIQMAKQNLYKKNLASFKPVVIQTY